MNTKKTERKYMWTTMAVAILMALSLTACSARPQKDEVILKDITEELSGFVKANEVLEQVEVQEHELNEEAGVDTVMIKTESSDGLAAYTRFFEAVYYLEKKKWVYGELRAHDEEQWGQRPLMGIRKEDISAGLQQQYVAVDGEQWQIQDDCIAELTVLRQDTDLQAGKDILTVALVIDDVVERASGQLELVYIYDKGWQLEACQGGETFAVEVKPGKELEATVESLADKIVAQELSFGNTVASAGQTIHMKKEEISDLTITSCQPQDKGRVQIYEFGFNLSRERADFHIDGTARYCYASDG